MTTVRFEMENAVGQTGDTVLARTQRPAGPPMQRQIGTFGDHAGRLTSIKARLRARVV
eukprot:gene7426-1327_t